jgi:hypothetical protein
VRGKPGFVRQFKGARYTLLLALAWCYARFLLGYTGTSEQKGHCMHNARRTTIIGAFLLAFIIALLPRLSAASPASGSTSPASASVARQDQPPRFFAARLNIYGIDDDWPDTDDPTNQFYGPFEKVMHDNDRNFTFQIPGRGWGGECRVEVDQIKVELQPNGTIEFSAFARFWEGTDEGRTNLRDAKTLQVTIPRKVGDFRYQERLTWEGGDFVDIKWSFDNVINE